MKRKAFTLVEIMIVVAIIALLAAIAIPNLLRAMINANESSAVSSLKTIVSSATAFRSVMPRYPAALAVLANTSPPYIDVALGSGRKNGYNFALIGGRDDFISTACPVNYQVTGVRSFFTDQSGIIRSVDLGLILAGKSTTTGRDAIANLSTEEAVLASAMSLVPLMRESWCTSNPSDPICSSAYSANVAYQEAVASSATSGSGSAGTAAYAGTVTNNGSTGTTNDTVDSGSTGTTNDTVDSGGTGTTNDTVDSGGTGKTKPVDSGTIKPPKPPPDIPEKTPHPLR